MRLVATLGTILVLLASAAAVRQVLDIRHGLASESWPTTDAVVTVDRGGRRTKRFEYAYQVGGREYRSGQAGFALPPYHQERRFHDVGDTIRIRYDPQDPRRAVVRPGITTIGAITGFLPSAAILGFVAYVALHLRRKK